MEKDIDAGEQAPGTNNRATTYASSRDSETVSKKNEPRNALRQHPSTATSNHLSLSEVEPVDIQIRNLAVDVDISSFSSPLARLGLGKRKRNQDGEAPLERKKILHSVSASMCAGTLTAIIGGSGSGKTTMLNTMAERMTSGRITFQGTTTFNGVQGVRSVRAAYVMQQDVLLPTLTVRETLQYSADLRLPPPTTEEERRKVVEEVILELGLFECADTRIGNHQHKGCSGGEKRRTSIGVQLLSNPSVLFLDEPTTGLDATSAFQLVRTLKHLAGKGRTIVTTIHQPRSEIWGMFDGLVILTRGSPVYSGKASDCLAWFEKVDMELPEFVNPADFLIDIAAVDNRTPELEASSIARVEKLKNAWLLESENIYNSPEKETKTRPTQTKIEISKTPSHSPFIRQTRVLTSRTFLVTWRDPLGMTGSLLEAVGMGIITGWVFYDMPRDQSGIRSREGALYNAAALQGYLILMFETYRLTVDMPLFDREHNENVVDVIPFMLSRRLARFFTEDLPVPLLYSVIFYYMAGFRAEASTFLTFFSVVLLCQFIAVTYAMACVAASRNFAGASLIANLGYTIQSMACGFFVQANAIPVYVRWLKWTAYVFYAFSTLAANEFVGQFYDCPLPGGESDPACLPYTGRFIMDSLAFPHNWVIRPIIILLAYVIMFYTSAWIGLRFLKVEMSIAKARHTEEDLSAGKEKMTVRSAETRTVDIGLDKFGLAVDKRTILGRKLPTKTILHPITAQFRSGTLNVIMGPSGSGKTSLLNSMALRLHNNVNTQYRHTGDMTFNSAIPSDSVIRSVCSYVCQDDDALLPSLTVRETLRFSARLRLPSFMSKEQKNQRAEEVLMKLSLKDCADSLIGSDMIKGISGGEKRRVSIAVQILTDPRVLLLDEPTSGLDAFTASSIMDVLGGLANEGRTLILTIHQARSDLFQQFGNVLLLARGGSLVYAGEASKMLPHFASQGYVCPTTTNPADFALDLITVDLQQSSREEASRLKVHGLISAWTNGDFHIAAQPTTISTPAELGALIRKPSSFFSAYPILVHRASICFRREPPLLVARIMQVLGLAIILTLFFAPLKNDYPSVQTRLGFIQEFCAFYFVGMLQNVAVYPVEKDVFYRENDDGTYGVEAFFLQYLTLEVPFEIGSSLMFAVLVCLAGGLPRTVQMFFVCFFNCFCIVSCGESLGIMVSFPLSLTRQPTYLHSTVQHHIRTHRLRHKRYLPLPVRRPDHVRCPLNLHATIPLRHELSLSSRLRDAKSCPLFSKRYQVHL